MKIQLDKIVLSKLFSNKTIASVKVWQQNLIWKNTCGLTFDRHNVQQLTNIQQKSTTEDLF